MSSESLVSVSDAHAAPRSIGALDELILDMIDTAALPLDQARTLPRRAYVDEAYFEREVRDVLRSNWLCAGHVSQVDGAGAFRAVDVLREPMVLTRDDDNQVRVLSRVCPHRGTDILSEAFELPRHGKTRRLTCPYHAWSFALNGQLKACPEMDKAAGFDKADWQLAEIRSEVWQGFIFVNLDGRAPPLSHVYADFAQLIAPWNTADMQVAIELDWTGDFNWKVMCENWIESYHHLGIHYDTLQRTLPARTTWTDESTLDFIHCHLPFSAEHAQKILDERAGGEKLSGFLPIDGLADAQVTEWGLFIGLPTFLFLTMRDRVLWYQVEPVSAGRCSIKTMTMVSREAAAAPGYQQSLAAETTMLADFHRQDMQVNTAVQRGLDSTRAVRGRLSHLEEPIWRIQRYLAACLKQARQ